MQLVLSIGLEHGVATDLSLPLAVLEEGLLCRRSFLKYRLICSLDEQ